MADDKNGLLTLVSSLLPDNDKKEISPSDLRTVLSQMIDSDMNLAELTDQIALGLLVVNALQYETTLPEPPWREGQTFYDPNEKALSYYNNESDTLISTGKEVVLSVYNGTGSTITNGSALRSAFASVGGVPSVALSLADTVVNSTVVAIATHDIPAGQTGIATYIGKINGIDTSAIPEGSQVYLSDTVPGGLTATPPNIVTGLGLCLVSDPVNGVIITGPTRAAVPVALGQALTGTPSTMLVTTTPAPVEGYTATPFEVNVSIDSSIGAQGDPRCIVSPAEAGFSGYYDLAFKLTCNSSANVVLTCEIYVNGSPSGVKSTFDFRNNNTDDATVVIPRAFSQAIVTPTDQLEVYIYSTASTTITVSSISFNAKRAGIS